jgi:transcriptional regulator with XRE-family HTH domain
LQLPYVRCRAALGWNQAEFALLMGVAKTTVARIETLEMSARAEFITKAMRVFRQNGVNDAVLSGV